MRTDYVTETGGAYRGASDVTTLVRQDDFQPDPSNILSVLFLRFAEETYNDVVSQFSRKKSLPTKEKLIDHNLIYYNFQNRRKKTARIFFTGALKTRIPSRFYAQNILFSNVKGDIIV
jgi:hypothetical protein